MNRRDAGAPARFRESLAGCGVAPEDRVLVALSGGSDSVVLLHLLRFAAGRPKGTIVAAHLDHAMRSGSRADAAWVEGLCASWEVPLLLERVPSRLRNETDARATRYAFLKHAAEQVEARWVVTAHHADDQAETVLFRALRGAGTDGLAGILPRAESLVRPLLPFWRSELRAYARDEGIRWRQDPTNRSLRPARNRLRRQILPLLERTVAPGARRNLVRLAEIAREERAGWDAAVTLLVGNAAREEEGHLLLERTAFRTLPEPLAARVLRGVLSRHGIVLSRVGTRRVVQFITDAASGRVLQIPGGARLYAEREVARLTGARELPTDQPLRVSREMAERGGCGEAWIGGRGVVVQWCQGPASGAADLSNGVELPLERLRYPLDIRGRQEGDQVRTPGGTKSLKKLLIERRVPRVLRSSVAVLAERHTILWVRGLVVAADRSAVPGEPALLVHVSDA